MSRRFYARSRGTWLALVLSAVLLLPNVALACVATLNSESHLRPTDTTASAGPTIANGTTVTVTARGTQTRGTTHSYQVTAGARTGYLFLTDSQLTGSDCAALTAGAGTTPSGGTPTPSGSTPSGGTPSGGTAPSGGGTPSGGARTGTGTGTAPAPASGGGSRFCNFRCASPAATRPAPSASVRCTASSDCLTACSATSSNSNSCAAQIPGSTCATTPAPTCQTSGPGRGYCSYSCTLPARTETPNASVPCSDDAICDSTCNSQTEPNSCAIKIPGSRCATDFRPICGTDEQHAAAQAGTAQTAPSSYDLENPLPTDDISLLIGRVIKAVMGILGAVALLMFVIGGLMWMTAGGSDERYKKSMEIIKNAGTGLILVFFSYGIVSAMLSIVLGGSGTSTPTTTSGPAPGSLGSLGQGQTRICGVTASSAAVTARDAKVASLTGALRDRMPTGDWVCMQPVGQPDTMTNFCLLRGELACPDTNQLCCAPLDDSKCQLVAHVRQQAGVNEEEAAVLRAHPGTRTESFSCQAGPFRANDCVHGGCHGTQFCCVSP